ncbi:MAG TPA: hypothetical protein VEG44_03540 [Candidatus Acidoferrales bacterium]|nr:hypothetical protein [Candidatus Acidoferrales bacterium]
MQRMLLEIITLIAAVAVFTVLLLAVSLAGIGSLGYVLVILAFLIVISIAGVKIANYEVASG